MGNQKSINLKVIIIVGIVFFAVVIAFFAFRFFTPFGAVVSYQFSSILNKDKVSALKGSKTADSFNPGQSGVLQIPQQVLRQSIATFNLKLISKPIEGVWVNLRFKGNPRRLKIGVKGSEKEKYIYQPLYNHIIETSKWNKTIDNGFIFLQKEKKYQQIGELFGRPPLEETVASFYFDPSKFIVENKNTTKNDANIEKELRGSHTLFVKVDKKPFILTVKKQDLNAYKGEDILSVQVYNGQVKMAEQIIPDDGVIDNGRLKMSTQTSEIKINDAKPGIYKIVLKDKTENSDVLIKSFKVNQPLIVIDNNLFIIDNKPSTLWTNINNLTMSTTHVAGIQTVRLDGKYDLKVEKEGKENIFDLSTHGLTASKVASDSSSNLNTIHKLEIPKNDLFITGDGYFAFSEDSFFNPEPIKTVDLTTINDLSKIDYILADYTPVEKEGDWSVAQAYFDPKDIKIDGDKLYFSLESPELDSYGGEIVVDNLEVTVKKPGWLNNPDAKQISPDTKTPENKQMNIIERIINFFKNLFSPKKEAITEETGENPQVSPSPTKMPDNTPTPSPKPQDLLKITVLNAGAGKGSAGKFAGILTKNGFQNVIASNSASFDNKNATIKFYKNIDGIGKEFITQIISLLKEEYDLVIQDNSEKDKEAITITLGENPKNISPTPVASISAVLTPTVKP